MSGFFLGRKTWPDYAGWAFNQDLAVMLYEEYILEHWLNTD